MVKLFLPNIIGFIMMVVAFLLAVLTGFIWLSPMAIAGALLFASWRDEDVFVDYVLLNGKQALMRKRSYFNTMPFAIISMVLTLGKGTLQIPYREQYHIVTLKDKPADNVITPLTRAQYMTLRDEQRRIYTTQTMSRAFMDNAYGGAADIGYDYKHKKNRLIAAAVLAGIVLTGLTDPAGWPVMLIYEAVFLPMVLLWIPPYKDAKILQEAYNRSVIVAQDTVTTTG